MPPLGRGRVDELPGMRIDDERLLRSAFVRPGVGHTECGDPDALGDVPAGRRQFLPCSAFSSLVIRVVPDQKVLAKTLLPERDWAVFTNLLF